MYMNICDDVYRNQVEDFELSDGQKDEIVEVNSPKGISTYKVISIKYQKNYFEYQQ